MRVKGLGGRIDHKSLLRHGLHQSPHVVADSRSVVSLAQETDDVIERTVSVTQPQYLRRRRIEANGAFGDEQQVLLAHLVIPQPCTGDEAGTGHACSVGGVDGWESPRSMASSCAHSISVLKRSAATAASCCSRVAQRSTVSPSA